MMIHCIERVSWAVSDINKYLCHQKTPLYQLYQQASLHHIEKEVIISASSPLQLGISVSEKADLIYHLCAWKKE